MLAGVTIVNPGATVIDADVEIGSDTVIAPFTCLHGDTRIGSGSTIGPGCTLIDAQVGDGATILHSYINGRGRRRSRQRRAVRVSAARAPCCAKAPRPARSSRSRTPTSAPGTKVPHLSYIGDADIGEDTNLGAATITANYDGYRKHRTTIGSRVKTSVDTTLVAPVTVGDDAFTAAGSVIGNDVPPGALGGSPGVARSQQRNVDGYAERRRRQAENDSEGERRSTSDGGR